MPSPVETVLILATLEKKNWLVLEDYTITGQPISNFKSWDSHALAQMERLDWSNFTMR